MAWIFVVGVLTLPVAEIMVWVRVSDSIGGLATVALTVLAIFAGMVLLRHGGLGMALEVRSRMARGEPPGPAVFDQLCIAMAGFLLLLPGLISDVMAVLLMSQTVRLLLLRALASRIVVRNADAAPSSGPTIIDGDYEIIPPESTRTAPPDHKRLEP
jgi:UPF0716 protein FxsA